MSKTTVTMRWDEPAGCATPRGWLLNGPYCVGDYLDYGPGHYRSPHAEILNTVNGPIERVWCQPGQLCRSCQPGNVHAVRYPDGPNGAPRAGRYFETVAEARAWIETGA